MTANLHNSPELPALACGGHVVISARQGAGFVRDEELNMDNCTPSVAAAVAANRAIDAALALDVSKLNVAEINIEATDAAAASPDARLDRAYAKLKAQLSRFEQFEDHAKAACISHVVAQVEYAAESLANAADEANEDDKELHRRLKSGAGYSRRVENDVPAPGTNTNKAIYGGGE